MTRGIHRLSGADLRRREPGLYSDGGGLKLQVTAGTDGNVNRSWIFRFSHRGRVRDMGLGSLHDVTLAAARDEAQRCRLMLRDGRDPIEQRLADRAAQATTAVKSLTFDQAAAAYIAAHRDTWRNERHAAQWPATLRKYASPIIGRTPVAMIDTPAVMRVLTPIWSTITKTASDVRQRIEAILDWSTVGGYRTGENPARWSGHLEHLLGSPRKLRKIQHYDAMPFADVPAFVAKLRATEGTMARLVEFTVLTAVRRGEGVGARWDEVDFAAKVWTIPASRTKTHIEHRVPLSDAAIAVLHQQAAVRRNDFVFPGRGDSPIRGSGLTWLRGKLGCTATLHGFRSSFRDWAGEVTSFPREVAEQCLGHKVGDAVELAYRRGTALEKRRLLMQAWATYLARPPASGANVTTIHGR